MPKNKRRQRSTNRSPAREQPAPPDNPNTPSSDGLSQGAPPLRPKTQSAAGRSDAQRQARRQAGRRNSRRVQMYVGASAAALVILIVILVIVSFSGPSGPGQSISDQGRRHLQIGETYEEYNSDPQTSGPHSPSWMPPGHYSDGAPDRRLIHSLEHGYVILHYNCHSTECPGIVNQVARLSDRFQTKFIVNYRPRTTATIAMTAWTRLLVMDKYDEAEVIEFIEAYRGKIGPERDVPG